MTATTTPITPAASGPMPPTLGGASQSDRDRAASELKQQRAERLAILKRKPAFLIGAAITVFWLVCALFGSVIAPQDPLKQNLLTKLQNPTAKHWFGTDNLGRDVFSRVIVGTRPILFIALGATIVGTIFGSIMGLVAGYFKGWVDEVLMRIADVMMAMPTIVFALLVIATLQSKSSLIVLAIIGIVYTPIIARTVRATVLGESELDYVSSAKLRTEKTPHILFVEILPNIVPPLLVEFTVRLGYAIFAVATLSFLGAGVTAESPDWGSQVANHYKYLNGLNWSATVFPALAVAMLAVAVNLMADGLVEVFER